MAFIDYMMRVFAFLGCVAIIVLLGKWVMYIGAACAIFLIYTITKNGNNRYNN